MENKEMQEISDGLLSIVVPIYKVEKYLNRCVESLVNQTYGNIEIILVDDGSPDRCPEMCDHWAERDSRIRVIHKANGGLSDARNAGMKAANGAFIAFVDSDDYVELTMYEIMLSAIQRTDADIACCGRYIVADDLLRPMHTLRQERIFDSIDAIKELLLGISIEEATWDKVYKRELFRGIEFPVGENNEDIVVIPKVLARASNVVHVGCPLYYYCQNAGSITKSAYSAKKRVMLKHLDDLKQYLEDNYRELLPCFDAVQGRYCQSALYLLLDNWKVYKEYHADYCEFYRRFKISFRGMVNQVPMSKTERIKGCLIYCKLYLVLHGIKKGAKQ